MRLFVSTDPDEWQEDPDYEAAGCPDDYLAEGEESEL